MDFYFFSNKTKTSKKKIPRKKPNPSIKIFAF